VRADTTEQLVARLARDLRPVRPVAALRRELAGVAAVVLAVVAAVVLAMGLRPNGLGVAPGEPPFAAIALGLAAAGFGAVLGALALARPGRETAASSAALAGATALALCAGVAAATLEAGPHARIWGGLGEVPCVLFALVLALPVALLVTYRAGRSAVLHRGRTAFLAGTGAMALGTLAAHLTCRTPGAWHAVFTHSVAPLIGGLVLALPLYALLRRLAHPTSLP